MPSALKVEPPRFDEQSAAKTFLPHLLARRRDLPVIVDSMSKPYCGRSLCVAVKQWIETELNMQVSATELLRLSRWRRAA